MMLFVVKTLFLVSLLALGGLAGSKLTRRFPAARYRVAWCSVVAIALAPLVVAGSQSSRWHLELPVLAPTVIGASRQAAHPVASPSLSPLPEGPVVAAAASVLPPQSSLDPGKTVLLAAWILGACFVGLQFILGIRHVRKLLAASTPAVGVVVQEATGRAKSLLGVRKFPLILESGLAARPVVVGCSKPKVVLPIDISEQLDTEQLRDVLLHEYAHIYLRHMPLLLVQRGLAVLYWFNPLIHLLHRELSAAREEVCDNFVLHLSSPAQFARTLLVVAERSTPIRSYPVTAGLLEPGGKLEQRVSGLLDPKRKLAIQLSRFQMATISSTFAISCLLLAGTQLTHAQSKQMTVEVSQGGKVYTFHPTNGKPLTVKVKNGHRVTKSETISPSTGARFYIYGRRPAGAYSFVAPQEGSSNMTYHVTGKRGLPEGKPQVRMFEFASPAVPPQPFQRIEVREGTPFPPMAAAPPEVRARALPAEPDSVAVAPPAAFPQGEIRVEGVPMTSEPSGQIREARPREGERGFAYAQPPTGMLRFQPRAGASAVPFTVAPNGNYRVFVEGKAPRAARSIESPARFMRAQSTIDLLRRTIEQARAENREETVTQLERILQTIERAREERNGGGRP